MDSISIAQLKQMVQTLPSKKRPLAHFEYLEGLAEVELQEFCSYFEADFYQKCIASKSGTFDEFCKGEKTAGMYLLGQILQQNILQLDSQKLFDIVRDSTGDRFEIALSLLYFTLDSSSPITPCPVRWLFKYIEQVNEPQQKVMPLKKILLLLWKLMNRSFGVDLMPSEKTAAKVTPHDMHKIKESYSKRFAQFRSSAIAEEKFVLDHFLFQPLLPQQVKEEQPSTKSPPLSPTADAPGDGMPKMPVFEQLPLMFGKVPISVNEGFEVYRKSLYISDFSKQMAQEKVLMNQMGYSLDDGCSDEDAEWLKHRLALAKAGGVKLKEEPDDEFILENIRDFGTFFITLLKIFLALCGTNSQSPSPVLQQISQYFNAPEPKQKLACSEIARRQLEHQRQKEIGSKAISFMLLLLLKKAKRYHGCMYEYFCQLLADSNCILLTLKILNQDVAAAMTKNDDDFSFLYYSNYMGDNQTTSEEEEEARDQVQTDDEVIHACPRNFHMTINMLRIVQMLVKNKPGRISVLLQYKGPQILRKMLKSVENKWLNLYSYKILKNLVPYLGRKWRQNNMKVITGIYTHLRPDMKEDWLANFTETQLVSDESRLQERKLRNLIHFYLARKWNFNLLKVAQQAQQSLWTFETLDADGNTKTFNVPYIDSDHVEHLFKLNTQAWLEMEVYSKIIKLEPTSVEPAVSIASSPEPQDIPEPIQLDSAVDSTMLSHEEIAEDVVFGDNDDDFDVFSGDGAESPESGDEQQVVHVDEVEDRNLQW